MKYFAKWLWIVTLIVAILYSIYDFIQNGFNWRTITNLIIVVSSVIVLFYKK